MVPHEHLKTFEIKAIQTAEDKTSSSSSSAAAAADPPQYVWDTLDYAKVRALRLPTR